MTDAVIGLETQRNIEDQVFNSLDLYLCGFIGIFITGLIIWITEYYTGVTYRPVKSVAAASETGHGTNVIQGLAVSMEATALPALVIVIGIISTFYWPVCLVLRLRSQPCWPEWWLHWMPGPVTDNGGIAEMAELPEEVHNTTDAWMQWAIPPNRNQRLCHRFSGLGCAGAVCCIHAGFEIFHIQCG